MKPCRGEYCAAQNCSNNRGRCKHLSFFRFPRDEERCKRWVKNCLRTDLNNLTPHLLNNRYSLCADHFEDAMFMNLNERNRLVHDAVPTLFEAFSHNCFPKMKQADSETSPEHTPEADVEESISIVNRDHMYSVVTADVGNNNLSTSQIVTTCTGTGDVCGAGAVRRYHRDNLSNHQRSAWQQTDPPSRRDKVTSTTRVLKTVEELRLRKILRRQCKQIARMQKQVDSVQEKLTKATKSYKVKDLIEGSKHYLSGLAHSFFSTQLLLSSKKAQGKRWPDDVKKFVVSIYKTSPKAYRLLSKEFILPSKKSIRKVAVAEGDSVENAINSVVESSFNEHAENINQENFQIGLQGEEKLMGMEKGQNGDVKIADYVENVDETVEHETVDHSFQQLHEMLQFNDNILQPSDVQTVQHMSSGQHHSMIEPDTELILTSDSSVPVMTQQIQSEDGNISVIYPTVQELQQILPLEIFHYMVQQT